MQQTKWEIRDMYFDTDKVPVPEGHSVARAMLGFDGDGDLLIVQCDEHWAPFEYNEEDNLFVGSVQRLVYFRRTEEQPPETITYFQVNSDNTISLYDNTPQYNLTPEGKVPPQYNDCKIAAGAENLSPFLMEDFTALFPKFVREHTCGDSRPAHITTENVYGYEATVVRDPFADNNEKPIYAPGNNDPLPINKADYIGSTKAAVYEEGEIHLMNYPEYIESLKKKRDAMVDKAFEDNAKKRRDALLSDALSQPRKGPFDK